MESSDSDLSDCDEFQDHKKLPHPPDHDVNAEKLLLKQEPILAPNHKDLVRAGSSLGSISLPPKHSWLAPNHQELIWVGSSLGTMHKFPVKTKQNNSKDSFKGSQISGIQRVPSTLTRCKLSTCTFGSQTVSESGTDNFSFCRICQMQGDDRDPLFSPCRCSGSLRYIHGSCLKVSIHTVYLLRIVGLLTPYRGWLEVVKVSGILHQQGVQLILASIWARPAILVAGKGRGGMFLFLLFLHSHSYSSFFPVPLFHLLYYLFYLFSPFLGDDTK